MSCIQRQCRPEVEDMQAGAYAFQLTPKEFTGGVPVRRSMSVVVALLFMMLSSPALADEQLTAFDAVAMARPMPRSARAAALGGACLEEGCTTASAAMATRP